MTQIAIEMRQAIIALAGERGWCETRQRWLEKAARASGISYRTAKALFYAEMPDPKASIVIAVRQAVEKKSASEGEHAANEFALLEARMRSLENRLASIDPDFHREAIDALGAATNGLGGKNSSLDTEPEE